MRSRLFWPAEMGMWTVDDYPMCGIHQKPLGLHKLWRTLDIRGENEELPGQDGLLDREHFVDQSVRTINTQIAGGYNHAGTPYSNSVIGLDANYAALLTVATPPGTGNTVLSEILHPNGNTYSANIQLEVSEPEDERGLLYRCNITVTIPLGGHMLDGGS